MFENSVEIMAENALISNPFFSYISRITYSWDDIPTDKEEIMQWVLEKKVEMFSGPYHVSYHGNDLLS